MDDRAIIIIDSSDRNSDLYYATKFKVPDPVMYIEYKEESFLILNDLEVDRGKKEAQVTKVIGFSEYEEKLKYAKDKNFLLLDIILKEKEIEKILVSENFGAYFYKKLVNNGYDVEIKRGSLYDNRIIKTEEEKNYVLRVMKHVDDAFRKAVDVLKESEIDGEFLKYKGEFLTSEYLKKVINVDLMGNNAISHSIIVASGKQTVDPHNDGSGYIYANEPIIFDIFPQSLDTLYFGDQTRTVVKGKASDKLKDMWNTVFEGQKIGIEMLKDGVDGADIHNSILEYFNSKGYETGLINGRMQGFFHGTGHGVGLDIHEAPRINRNSHNILKEGHVITIEPGLYYEGIGGIRIEDTLFITRDGYENLSVSEKFLEIK
jgi:Xaa-Pro aminopeptidase